MDRGHGVTTDEAMRERETQKNYYLQVLETASRIYETLEWQNVTRGKDNPTKGECYVASALLYNIYKGKDMDLVKKKDHAGVWHWWIEIWDGTMSRVIDITREQYIREGIECPSDNPVGRTKAGRMGFKSYKNRMKILEDNLELMNKMDEWGHNSIHRVTGGNQNGGEPPP